MMSQVETLQGLVQHCPGSGLDPEGTEELRRLQTLEGHDWLSLLNPIVQYGCPQPHCHGLDSSAPPPKSC